MRFLTNAVREFGEFCGFSPEVVGPAAHCVREVARQMQAHSNPSSSPRGEPQSVAKVEKCVKEEAFYHKGFSPVIQKNYIKKENPESRVEKRSFHKLNFTERVVEKMYRRAKDVRNFGKQYFAVDLLKKAQQNSETISQFTEGFGVPKFFFWAFKKTATIANMINRGIEYKKNVPNDLTVTTRDEEDGSLLVSTR